MERKEKLLYLTIKKQSSQYKVAAPEEKGRLAKNLNGANVYTGR
jgi:hypothetical protein